MPSPSLTLLRTQSDERLAALAREGHERAFEAIVERYRRPLLRAARRVLPEGRAEDALQQALLSAWATMRRGDEIRDLRPWLFRIVHNCSLNALRVSGYDYDELEDTLRITDAPGDELERRAVVRQTLTSLAALPERQREALLRTAVSGYSNEQVARELGVSDNALRQLVHRARASMRAAATAVTPLPIVHWLVTAGSRAEPLAQRIAEATAGAAPAGAAALLAKAGTVAVVATSALTGPGIVDRVADRPPRDRAAAAAVVPEAPELPRPVLATGPKPRTLRLAPQRRRVANGTDEVRRRFVDRRERGDREDGGHRDDDGETRRDRDDDRHRGRDETDGEHHSGSGESGGDRESRSGRGGETDRDSSGSDDLSHSGSGFSGDGGDSSGTSGGGGGDSSGSRSGISGSGSSGSGGGDDPVALELPAATAPEPPSAPAADATLVTPAED